MIQELASYVDAIEGLSEIWEGISCGLMDIRSWKLIYLLCEPVVFGFRCVSLMDFNGRVYTVPTPLNWEFV